MNNEPVALTQIEIMNALTLGIPLYTHPVKEQDESFDRTASHMAGEYVSYKDLTDEEIMELSYLTSDNDPIVFARAILRKAQEK